MWFRNHLVLLANLLTVSGCHKNWPAEHEWEVWRAVCKTYAHETQVTERIPGRSIYTWTSSSGEIAWPGGEVVRGPVDPRHVYVAAVTGQRWDGEVTDANCDHAQSFASTCRFEEVDFSAEFVETTSSGPVRTGIELLSRVFYDHARGQTLGSSTYLTMPVGESMLEGALDTMLWSKGPAEDYVKCGSGMGPQDVFDVTAYR